MASYRRRFDIIADILEIVSQGAKKTRIMYQANLSYKLLTKYLTETRKAYLIRFEQKRKCYMLTKKGEEFLIKYREYSKTNKHIERQINNVHTKRKTLENLCSNKQ